MQIVGDVAGADISLSFIDCFYVLLASLILIGAAAIVLEIRGGRRMHRPPNP